MAQSWLWIDWERHSRTRSLCRRLDLELLEMRIPGPRLLRYLKSSWRTLTRIRAARPTLVIATNPSLMLGLLLLLLRRWYGFALVADAHYAGVRALSGSALLQRLLDFYNARVALVIVTNEPHALYLRARGCQAFVCPDPLPVLPQPLALALPPRSVFLVCSFDPDEPYGAVFAAFGELAREAGYTLIVSGNYAKAGVDPRSFPGVRLLGYVPEAQYFAYLQACALVMDLTALEDCLLCGAYEALAAGKPLITSASAALRDYFGDAALYTAHEPRAIAASIEQAFAQREELTRRAVSWRARNEQFIGERLAELRGTLQGVARGTLPTDTAPQRARDP